LRASSLLQAVNVEGTKNILAAARRAGIRRLIYTSSIHAIRRAPAGIQINEELPFDPDNPYGPYDRTKAEASLAVLRAAEEGLDTVIVCPTGVIGPHDYRRSELGQMIHDCVNRRTQWYVDGAYDFVDVRDVADGMILAAEKGRSRETYILSGERITVRRLIDSLWDLTGGQFARIHVPVDLARFVSRFTPLYYRLTGAKPRLTAYALETLQSNSDISHAKASRELGYSPRSLMVTLADTVSWFRSNRRLFSRPVKKPAG
jgi:dihydroflavonol-4-reductase